MLRAIIFDFDGLMLETEQPYFQSWQELYHEHGVELPLSTWLPMIDSGSSSRRFHPHDHLEQHLGRSLDREEIRTRRRQRYHESVALQPLIREAQSRGLHLAVASSSSREWVMGHLIRLGLYKHFEYIMCGDDVKNTKPFPDIYETTLQKLNIYANEAIALEDSPNGVQAAKQAGIFCVVVPNPLTMALQFVETDLRLVSLAELTLDELTKKIR